MEAGEIRDHPNKARFCMPQIPNREAQPEWFEPGVRAASRTAMTDRSIHFRAPAHTPAAGRLEVVKNPRDYCDSTIVPFTISGLNWRIDLGRGVSAFALPDYRFRPGAGAELIEIGVPLRTSNPLMPLPVWSKQL